MVLTKRRYTSEFKQGAIELTIKLSSIKEAAMEELSNARVTDRK